MSKEQSFETVAKIVFDRGVSFLMSGNPAFDTERCLNHIELVMTEWGYRSALVSEYCDIIKRENDLMRELGLEDE